MDKAQAQKLVEAAHQVCPYSNATRGNIEVTLEVGLARRLARPAGALSNRSRSSTRAFTGVRSPAEASDRRLVLRCDAAIEAAGRPQHRHPRRQRRLLEHRAELVMHRAVAGGGDDQAVDAGVDQRTDAAAIDAGRAGQRSPPTARAHRPAEGVRRPPGRFPWARRAIASRPCPRPGRATRRHRTRTRRAATNGPCARRGPNAARRRNATTTPPRPAWAATAIASARLRGPSASRDVAGPHRRRSAPPACLWLRRAQGNRPSPRACRCHG